MKKSFPLSDPSESPLEAPTNGLYLSIKSQEKVGRVKGRVPSKIFFLGLNAQIVPVCGSLQGRLTGIR